MHAATIAETDSSFVLVLDKNAYSKETIDRLRERFLPSKIEDVGFVDADEQAELDRILGSLTDEDREIVFRERIRFDD